MFAGFFFYNLKQLEPIFIAYFGTQYSFLYLVLTYKHMHNFPPHLRCVAIHYQIAH